MPFLAEEHIDIPATDLLSWMFNNQTYDANKPVSGVANVYDVVYAELCRSTSTQQNPDGQYHQTRPEV